MSVTDISVEYLRTEYIYTIINDTILIDPRMTWIKLFPFTEGNHGKKPTKHKDVCIHVCIYVGTQRYYVKHYLKENQGLWEARLKIFLNLVCSDIQRDFKLQR